MENIGMIRLTFPFLEKAYARLTKTCIVPSLVMQIHSAFCDINLLFLFKKKDGNRRKKISLVV